jgi:hypothetical protein
MSAPARTQISRIGTPQHFRWLEGIVKGTLILNLLDALFTLVWVIAGLAREANPLLDHLLLDHPVAFVVVKLSLVSLGSLLLWRYRSRPLAVVAIFVSFLAYYALLLVHVDYLATVLGILWLP